MKNTQGEFEFRSGEVKSFSWQESIKNHREPCSNADLWMDAGQKAHYLSRPVMLCKYELVKDRKKITQI